MTTASTPEPTPDYTAIKQRQQATWASGDYAVVGTTLQIVGEQLAEAADVRSDERVLDVAAGNGNATLAAARRYARVTSTDYVPELLDKGRRRAEAEGLDVSFEVADVEALPYEAASFDVVISTFGVMFAPDHASAAREMLRVTRPGGRIAMANWTPEGFIGRLFKTIGAHVPPPAGVRSPALWGNEAHLTSLFGPAARALRVERKHFNFRYRSAAHFLQVFGDYYGPTHKALASLNAQGRAALLADIASLLGELDVGRGRGLVVPSEYAEVVITVA
ncbi:class I SAM-dependent methyltransferase [uncultured Azohydromonas sp.]|jgi:Methylase involved in ubiquinone/menaquinone biosynthesis|uniref:class I SAM-dependent methyltransferase n=1 Tax=uncultured Azohydromonas sp. TaxID=487342 RepID=UPI00262AA820|nr:class I SAM-dependent methyltransferase [uncultured Azohydromonas sp.]